MITCCFCRKFNLIMKLYSLNLLWLLTFVPFWGSAQVDTVPNLMEGVDTLYIEVNAQQQKFIKHKVQKGQTLYRISKFFSLELEDVYYYNNHLKDVPLSVDEELRLPFTEKALIRKWNETLVQKDFVPVYYVVKPKETLYTISRSYFMMSPALMQQNNEKPTTDLSKGEKLLVGWLDRQGVNDSIAVKTPFNNAIYKANSNLRTKYQVIAKTKKLQAENGIALWKNKQKPSEIVNFFVLHRKAPINSVLEITNPMTGRTFYAKVTGRIPKSTYDRNIKVVVTPSLAKALGAIDPKFHVKINYFRN